VRRHGPEPSIDPDALRDAHERRAQKGVLYDVDRLPRHQLGFHSFRHHSGTGKPSDQLKACFTATIHATLIGVKTATIKPAFKIMNRRIRDHLRYPRIPK
jgi:hypothetical protein